MNKRHLVVLGLLTLFFYFPTFFLYFEGDEWYYFTQFLPLTRHWWGLPKAIYKSIAGSETVSQGLHLAPVYNTLWFLHNQFFGVQALPYLILSVLCHLVNTFLLYYLAYLLSKNRIFAFIAALFFGLTYIHRQAITWVMAYIPTQISVTFFLLAFIFFLKSFETKHIHKFFFTTFIFLLLALFTKESAIILFPIMLLFLTELKNKKKLFFTYFSGTLIFYLFFRFFLPPMLLFIRHRPSTSTPTNHIDVGLQFFRLITYPLKTLVEVFIPGEWILKTAEFHTPFAYPAYSADKAVRGLNFLTFTQSAGSDIIIYLLSIAIIFGLIKIYMHLQSSVLKRLFLTGILTITLSAIPLIAIGIIFPWWGYVTFIDSRHFYLTSVGGALIFAIVLQKLLKRPYILITVLILWSIAQYQLHQLDFKDKLKTASQRKKIISTILDTIPENKKNKIVFLKSNIGYYGFNPIPPFQTNLGQILTIQYYARRLLPEQFITSDYLTSGGIAGEGYKVYEGKGFGYFLEEKTLLEKTMNKEIKPDDIYAFTWNGTNDTIAIDTENIKKKLKDKLTQLKTIEKWKTYTDNENKFSFRYPFRYTLAELKPEVTSSVRYLTLNESNQSVINFSLNLKPESLGIMPLAAIHNDLNGNLISDHTTDRTIHKLNEDVLTAVYITNTDYLHYFLPFKTNEKYFELTGQGINQEEFEKIISTISYQ